MSNAYIGDFKVGTNIRFPFTLNDSSGGRVDFNNSLEEADIVIFKDGSEMTLTAGTVTVNEPQFNSPLERRTGLYDILINVSTSPLSGFTGGSEYWVVAYADETVDGQLVTAVLAHFSIDNRNDAVDVTAISGDTLAADNLEAAYDGTGYVGGTIKQAVDIVAISGDAAAADALEAAYDGTTPTVANITQIGGSPTGIANMDAFFDGTGYAGGTTKLDVNLVSAGTDAISAAALAAAAVTKITDDIMAEVVETQGSYTVQQVLSIALAVLAGQTSNSGNTIETPDGVATRVAATTNGSNERTAMTLTPSS